MHFAPTEVTPNERLSYRQWAESPDAGIEVTVVFEANERGTRITFTQAGFGGPTRFTSEPVHRGMDETLEDLVLWLEHGIALPPSPRPEGPRRSWRGVRAGCRWARRDARRERLICRRGRHAVRRRAPPARPWAGFRPSRRATSSYAITRRATRSMSSLLAPARFTAGAVASAPSRPSRGQCPSETFVCHEAGNQRSTSARRRSRSSRSVPGASCPPTVSARLWGGEDSDVRREVVGDLLAIDACAVGGEVSCIGRAPDDPLAPTCQFCRQLLTLASR